MKEQSLKESNHFTSFACLVLFKGNIAILQLCSLSIIIIIIRINYTRVRTIYVLVIKSCKELVAVESLFASL